MVIANPIYDVAFKFLMENDRVAKFFIGTLLEETVEEVQVRPQEYIHKDDKGLGFSIFRLDFVATIKTSNGGYKKVLVEIQKGRNPLDLMRFRNYLGEQYKKQDEVQGELATLPIVTIYMLGFRLDDLQAAVVKVNRQYLDLVTHQVLEQKSSFVEKLSHDCYVVQLRRIQPQYQSRLEKMLSVFEQNYFLDSYGIIKEYREDTDDPEIQLMLERLHYFGTEPAEKKKLEDEQEALRLMDLWFREFHQKLESKDKELESKDKELESKDKELESKDKELESKDKELEAQAKLIEELKRKLEGN